MSYLQLYAHLVWSTYERCHLIDGDLERRLCGVLIARCEGLKATAVGVGVMPDHVHVLVSFPPSLSITRLVSDLKGGSSHSMSHLFMPGLPFKWQTGYGAFTLRKEDVPVVARYVANQKQHHATGTTTIAWEAPDSRLP